MSIFESMPAFLGVALPPAVLVLVGIFNEDKLIEWESRFGRRMRALVRAMRKAVKKSKKEWSRQYGR